MSTAPIAIAPTIEIAGRAVGPGKPALLIAEAGVNHDGDLQKALALVDVAADAGADAVKFQTFSADRLATRDAPKAEYQARAAGGSGESQHAMLKRLELSEDSHMALRARCRERGVLFLSTPFDEQSADLLERLEVPAFKLPSGELTNLPFLRHVARKGRPLIVSTGMADISEVDAAVSALRTERPSPELVLLQCTSNYPAQPEHANLRAMRTLAETFGVPAGYSDHTLGIEVALAAAALGACVIEKHFTLDKGATGPDHAASLEPAELAALVRGVRTVERALGDGMKRPVASEAAIAAVARKSVVAARDLAAGDVLDLGMLCMRRPGTGLPASALPSLTGRRLKRALRDGEIVTHEVLE